MPEPQKPSETDQEFVKRCMADKEMLREFPEEDQRLAVCIDMTEDGDTKQMIEKYIELTRQFTPANREKNHWIKRLRKVFNI